MNAATKTFAVPNVSDAYSYFENSWSASGSNKYIITRKGNNSYTRSFDISSIPKGAVIISASITYNYSFVADYSGIESYWSKLVKLPSFRDADANPNNLKQHLTEMSGVYDKLNVRFATYCNLSVGEEISGPSNLDEKVRGYGTFSNIVLTVTYEANDGTVSYGADGSWKQCKVYYGVDGSWRECKAHYGVDGDWKQVK